jgi:hypothetical protein
MKKYARALVAIHFVLGLAGAIKAEDRDGVIVTMPFEFVVGAKTFPAGTYTVRNSSDDGNGTPSIGIPDHSTAMLVLPYVSERVTKEPLKKSPTRIVVG